MKTIDKLVSDGVIEAEDKERIITTCCPSEYDFKDIGIIGCCDSSRCIKCWNREEYLCC